MSVKAFYARSHTSSHRCSHVSCKALGALAEPEGGAMHKSQTILLKSLLSMKRVACGGHGCLMWRAGRAVHHLSDVWVMGQHVYVHGLAQGAGGPRRAWRRSCCRACWTTPSAPTSPTSGARTWATPCRYSEKGWRPPALEPVPDAH